MLRHMRGAGAGLYDTTSAMLTSGLDKARRWAGTAVPGMPRADSNGHTPAPRPSPDGSQYASPPASQLGRRLSSPGLDNGLLSDEGLSEAERKQKAAYIRQQAAVREQRKVDEERLLGCIQRECSRLACALCGMARVTDTRAACKSV